MTIDSGKRKSLREGQAIPTFPLINLSACRSFGSEPVRHGESPLTTGVLSITRSGKNSHPSTTSISCRSCDFLLHLQSRITYYLLHIVRNYTFAGLPSTVEGNKLFSYGITKKKVTIQPPISTNNRNRSLQREDRGGEKL